MKKMILKKFAFLGFILGVIALCILMGIWATTSAQNSNFSLSARHKADIAVEVQLKINDEWCPVFNSANQTAVDYVAAYIDSVTADTINLNSETIFIDENNHVNLKIISQDENNKISFSINQGTKYTLLYKDSANSSQEISVDVGDVADMESLLGICLISIKFEIYPYATVTYESNGGSAFESEVVKVGTTITPPTPTKTGHTFSGWCVNENLTQSFNNTVTKDVILYARWTPVTMYAQFLQFYDTSSIQVGGSSSKTFSDFVFEVGKQYNAYITVGNTTSFVLYSGGTSYSNRVSDAIINIYSTTINSSVTLAGNTFSLTTTGGKNVTYTAKSTASSATCRLSSLAIRISSASKGITNYAITLTSSMLQGNYYRMTIKGVTYYLQMNYFDLSVRVGKLVTYGQPYGVLNHNTEQQISGKEFAGWTLNGELITSQTIVTQLSDHYLQPYNQNITFTAVLDNGGADTPGTESVTITCHESLPTIVPPTKNGYTFNGYYTGVDGTGSKIYNADGSAQVNYMVSVYSRLYAYWTAN